MSDAPPTPSREAWPPPADIDLASAIVAIHAIGQWRPRQIHCRWHAGEWIPLPATAAIIEQTWLEAAARPGVHLFDGPMCRLESLLASPDQLRLELSRTSYKFFMGTNMRSAHWADRYGPRALANPVGVSCALESADGYLLMGRRNDRVAYYPNRIHPFAGALEPAEPLDVFAEVQRELREELGFQPCDIGEARCLGLAEDRRLRQPELIWRIRANRTRRQIEQQVDASEHHATWSLAPEPGSVVDVLRQPEALTPVAIATTLLWGRGRFGAGWYRRSCEVARAVSAAGSEHGMDDA